ncbi:MAG TPA: glycosyltransferase family 1 protein [Chthoniobacterales bacterium]
MASLESTVAIRDGAAPVRVGVDLTPLLPGSSNGGSKLAVLQFLEALDQFHAHSVQLVLFVAEISEPELRERFGSRLAIYCTRRGRRRGSALLEAYRELCSQLEIKRLTRQSGIQVLYSPFGRYLAASTQVPMVALITDLLHRDYPESLPWKDRLWRHLNLKKLASSHALFQVPSDFSRQRLHATYGVPYERAFRTYQPIHERFDGTSHADGPRYFFYPARPWRHKNHPNLLRAYRVYRDRVGQPAWRLVLTGSNDGAVEPWKSLVAALDLKMDVDFLGEVSEERLAECYRGASALMFPSRYEGFGIPLIEAMHFGLPIICGRGGSQTEVAGDAALYVDVEDLDEMADAMVRVSEDPAVATRLAGAGRKQLARFALEPEVQKLVNALLKAREVRAAPFFQRELCRARFLAFDALYAGTILLAPLINAVARRQVNGP